jgi:hypothetical protein
MSDGSYKPDQELSDARDRGLSPPEVVSIMHRKGLSLIQAVRAYRSLYEVRLAEAQEAVGASPEYREESEQVMLFTERLLRLWERYEKRRGRSV